MHLPRHLVAPLACVALLIALIGAAPPAQAAQPEPPGAPTPAPAPEPALAAPSFARGTLAKRSYAVMIDNHPNANPQIGLDHAQVVFEPLA